MAYSKTQQNPHDVSGYDEIAISICRIVLLQIVKTNWQLEWMLWANEISRDFNLKLRLSEFLNCNNTPDISELMAPYVTADI